MSFSSSFAAQTHILSLCHTQLAAGGGAETTMHKTCSFLEKMQHCLCIPQCLVHTSYVDPDSFWQLLSTEPCIETSRYAPCFSTLYPHISYSACLCDVHGQTMPMLGCAAAFSLILPVHISDRLVHDRRRHTCTLSEHRCHLWRLWRFKRPQHRRPLRHRRSGLALFSAILRCKFGLRYGNLSLFQLAVPSYIMTTRNARPTQSTPPKHTGRLGPKSEASRHIRHAHYGGSVCSIFRLLCIAHLVTLPASGARVSTGVATVEGAITRCEKSGSPALAKRSDATDMYAPPFTRAHKRAYRRAVGRALRKGHTMYRGRRLTFQQLTGHAVHPTRQYQRVMARTPTQNPRSVCCAGTLGASPTQSLMNCTAGWICLSIASIRLCFYRKHTGPSRQNGQQADGLSYIPVLPSIKEVVFLRSLTRIYAPLLLFERENCSQAGFSIPGFRWTVGFL